MAIAPLPEPQEYGITLTYRDDWGYGITVALESPLLLTSSGNVVSDLWLEVSASPATHHDVQTIVDALRRIAARQEESPADA